MPTRFIQLCSGCVILGIGVGLLLTADLGSDGYSTLVNGIALSTGWTFLLANAAVSLVFLIVASFRGVFPGVGTLVQIAVVGLSVTLVLAAFETPATTLGRSGYLLAALPVLGIGIALYLGTHLGAGPAEGAAQAWDPPIPFRWSYSLLQGGGAVAGWALGAAVGPGTVLVIALLGPLVDLSARLLGQDLHPERR